MDIESEQDSNSAPMSFAFSSDAQADETFEVVSAWLRQVLPYLCLNDTEWYAHQLMDGGFCSENKLNRQLERRHLAFMHPSHRIRLCAWLKKRRRGDEENNGNEEARKAVPLQPIPSIDASPKLEPEELVTDEDKRKITSFVYIVVKQLQICTFSESDKISRGGGFPDNKVSVGQSGLECIHCANSAVPRKFFECNSTMLLPGFAIAEHVARCRRCPPQTRVALQAARERYRLEFEALPYGFQGAFLRSLCQRARKAVLRDPPKDQDCTGRTIGPVTTEPQNGRWQHGGNAGTPLGSSAEDARIRRGGWNSTRVQSSGALMTTSRGVRNSAFLGGYGDDDDEEFQRALLLDAMKSSKDRETSEKCGINVEMSTSVAEEHIAEIAPATLCAAAGLKEVGPQGEKAGLKEAGAKDDNSDNDSAASTEQSYHYDDDSWTEVEGAAERTEDATAQAEAPHKRKAETTPIAAPRCTDSDSSTTTDESWEGESFSILPRNSSQKSDRVRKASVEEDGEASSGSEKSVSGSACKRIKTASDKEEGQKSSEKPRDGINDDGASSAGSTSGWDTLGSVTGKVSQLNLERLVSGSSTPTDIVDAAFRSNQSASTFQDSVTDDDNSIASGSAGSTGALEPKDAWEIIVNLPIVEELRKKVEKASFNERSGEGATKSAGAGDATSAGGDDFSTRYDDETLDVWTSYLQYQPKNSGSDDTVGMEDVTNGMQDMATHSTRMKTTRKEMTVDEQRVANRSSNHILDAIRHCCGAVDQGLVPSEEVLILVATDLLTAHMELPATIMVELDREEIFSLITSRRRFDVALS